MVVDKFYWNEHFFGVSKKYPDAYGMSIAHWIGG
jgi:hypothetical protein